MNSERREKYFNVRWADHVVIIRHHINILNDTKTGQKKKAQRLLKKIEASEFLAVAGDTIADIVKSLKNYLVSKTDALEVNEWGCMANSEKWIKRIGKINTVIGFAHYLAEKLNKRVLCVANEGATLHKKITRRTPFIPTCLSSKCFCRVW